jgi:HD superfamily phosphodiesterase
MPNNLLIEKMSLFNKLLQFVMLTSSKYSIDESHGLGHSMEVLNFAHSIFQEEVQLKPYIEYHERIIYTSAVIHDMCDKKYMNEEEGILQIDKLLDNELHPNEISMVKFIISTMSYSKVKANGFPCMGPFQTAYNIVREADLLAAYDFDRCMIYNMKKIDPDLVRSFHSANELFDKRVLRHNDDNLFTTDYAKRMSLVLHSQALHRIKAWKNILKV